MTDTDNTSTSPEPTYKGLTDAANALFNTGKVATPEEANALRDIIDRLLKPGRTSNADGRDPANAGRVGQGF